MRTNAHLIFVIVPIWKSKERCKRSLSFSYSVTNATLGGAESLAFTSPAAILCGCVGELRASQGPPAQAPLFCAFLSFCRFYKPPLLFGAVCQLLKRGQMELSISFVIYDPVCRPDLLSSGAPESLKSLTVVKERGPGSCLQNQGGS